MKNSISLCVYFDENENQKIFVLDSKYYRYGATKKSNHLPDSASVVKCGNTLSYRHSSRSSSKESAKNSRSSVMPHIPGMGGKNKAPAKIYDTAAKVFENVPYASVSKSEVCDIYIPEGKGAFPVIMLVHGGGFAFENQRMSLMESVAKKAISEGYTIVAVDYRKSGEAQFPGALSDVKAAVRFVRANAEKYGFDSERIAVWDESAGAYLSFMTALTPSELFLDGDVKDNAGFSSST